MLYARQPEVNAAWLCVRIRHIDSSHVGVKGLGCGVCTVIYIWYILGVPLHFRAKVASSLCMQLCAWQQVGECLHNLFQRSPYWISS